FSLTYPEVLEEWVPEEDFRRLIETVNERLLQAFRPTGWTAVKDAVLGVATGWLWEDLGGEAVGVKKGLRGLERWVEEWNRADGRVEAGVRCVELRRTGYLCLDIQIPDPGIETLPEAAQPEMQPEMPTAPSIRKRKAARPVYKCFATMGTVIATLESSIMELEQMKKIRSDDSMLTWYDYVFERMILKEIPPGAALSMYAEKKMRAACYRIQFFPHRKEALTSERNAKLQTPTKIRRWR
ncbi:MAG: hypothetical protein Q9181_006465, partial [Wetmoreana brouardii]